MPMVVDESVEVRMRKLDGDTECKRQRLDRFGHRLDVIPYVLCLCGLYCVCSDENEGGPYPPYIACGVGLQIGYLHSN